MDGCHWYSINLELMHIHHRTQKIIEHMLHTKRRQRRRAGALSAAKSYPTSDVRDNGLECQAATAQERPGGATPRPRSGATAKRSYPASEVSGGREETPRVRGQGWPGEATSCLRPGVVTLRSHPEPKARGSSWEEPPTPEARAGGREEQPRSSGCAGAGRPRGAIPW